MLCTAKGRRPMNKQKNREKNQMMENMDANQWELSDFDSDTTDSAWEQFIQEPPPPENSGLESPEIRPGNNNQKQYYTEKGKNVDQPDNIGGIKWSSSHTSILSFGDPGSPIELQAIHTVKRETSKTKTVRSRPESTNREHVIAEWKRRERVGENLFTLSSLVPGLKKRDKASVLTKTIEYMKQMQEKMKTLEEQVAAKDRNVCAELTNRRPGFVSASSHDDQNPLIDIKVYGNTFLIKVSCFKASTGTLAKVIDLIEGLHLRVVTTNSVLFPENILELTLTSQAEQGFEMTTVDDIFKKLESVCGRVFRSLVS